jgi:hypothetical protein
MSCVISHLFTTIFHLPIVFKFIGAEVLIWRWEHDNLSAQDQCGVRDVPRFFRYDVILFSDRLSYLSGISRAEMKFMIRVVKYTYKVYTMKHYNA